MIPRPALARANLLFSRRIATRRLQPQARFQSTGPTSSTASSLSSHLAAGVAGGSTVALIGYAYYHTSGLKAAVQTTTEVKQYLQDTKDTVVAKAKQATKDTSQTLQYLRTVAKSYSAFIPGASGYVDATFDELEEVHKEHGLEMDKILKEIKEQLVKAANEGQADAKTAANVYAILSDGIGKLRELGKEAGKTLMEKNPWVKEKIGDGYQSLVSLAEKAGPEGKKTLDEVTGKVKELISSGKIDEDAVKQVQDLIRDKTASLKKLAGSGAASGALAGSGEKLSQLFQNVPGAQEAIDKAPHFSDLVSIASDLNDEASKLMEETISELVNVLEMKGKMAKELADRTKKDAGKTKS